MSASAITDAVLTMIRASSFLGTAGAGKDYGVLETSSGSCAVVETQGLEQAEQVFADRLHQADWSISVRLYSKMTGDPTGDTGMPKRTACMLDLLAGTIRADPELQGTVNRVTRLAIERELPPEGFVIAGGQTWQETQAILEVEEWPDG